MRDLRLLTASAALALLASGAGASGARAADQLTVVSWGGAYTTSQVKAYHEPFAKDTGVEILSEDYNGGLAQIRAQVESGNVTWDLVDLELSDVVRGCDDGLLEELDLADLPPAPDGTPAEEDFIEGTLHDCAVSTIIWSTVFAYDDTKFTGDKPATIADLFDLERFPGKRALRKNAKVNLEFALMADGVPADEVYDVLSTDEGVDRAFAKLDTIKDQVVWWEAGAQPPQLLADGEVAMTTAYNGRLFDAIYNEAKPFVIVWDGQVWDLDMWGMPVGADGGGTAWEFVKFSTDTQRLADQSNWISYGPARKSSMALVPEEIKPHLPTAPENFTNALQNDFEWWADNQDEMNERFNAWLAKS
jgi:putative spermidine/putrescine transport system substrate-binding protein